LGWPVDVRANRPMQKGCQRAFKSSLFPRAGSSRVSQQMPRRRLQPIVGRLLSPACFVVRQLMASFRRRRQAALRRRHSDRKTNSSLTQGQPRLPFVKVNCPGNRPDRIRRIAAIRVCRLSQLARLPRISARRSARPVIRSVRGNDSRQRSSGNAGPDLCPSPATGAGSLQVLRLGVAGCCLLHTSPSRKAGAALTP